MTQTGNKTDSSHAYDITDLASKYPVRFPDLVEMIGKGLTAVWGAWLTVCLVASSLHMAPVPQNPMGGWMEPTDNCFLLMAPDRQWLASHNKDVDVRHR